MVQRNEFINTLIDDTPIKEGMRVLDIGCATGEVTQLVANIVGEQGEVIGVDINKEMIYQAEENSKATNIKYINSDIYNLPKDIGRFDAIIGRRVLMYLPNILECLDTLKYYLKPNGIFCFQESDAINGGVGAEELPMHQYAIQLVWETIKSEGGNIHTGQQLYSIFNAIDVKDIEYKAEAVIQTSDDNDLEWLIEIMLPRIKKHQIVDENFSIDAFKHKLQKESENQQNAFIRDMAYGIWGRI